MSIEVTPAALAETVATFGYAYLLTLGEAPRPHVVAVHPTLADGVLRLPGLGRSSRRNIDGNSAVTLVWPPPGRDGYSLIVDGHAVRRADDVTVVPVRAVLHRSAPAPREPVDGECRADCVELAVEDPSGSSASRTAAGESR